MSIPDLNHNHVLPPHLGDPRFPSQLSPFPVTSLEVCKTFATSKQRLAILLGWLRFRQELGKLGITQGFQWLDGSFLEAVELTENRAPRDLDLVTYFWPPNGMSLDELFRRAQFQFPAFMDRDRAKHDFKVDHFPVTLSGKSDALVEHTRYWTGLFSHRRDGVWKGMLRVALNTAPYFVAGCWPGRSWKGMLRVALNTAAEDIAAEESLNNALIASVEL